MKHIQRKWIVILALFVAIAALGAFTLRGGDKPAYTTQRVQQGDIRQLVQATGTIDAVTTVQVGSQISGTISKLNADFNSLTASRKLSDFIYIWALWRCCSALAPASAAATTIGTGTFLLMDVSAA